MVWFRINIGRDKNADPKWLLPTICRLGHVTKRDIGSIKIFDRETKFEITREAEAKFKAAIAQNEDKDVKVDSAVAPGPKEVPARRGPPTERKPWVKPEGDRPARAEKPWKARSEGGEEKKPWKARTESAGAEERKPWQGKSDSAAPAAEKKPWKPRPETAGEDRKPWKKPEGGDAAPAKKAWVPRAEAAPAAPGEKPWKGKPKGGDRPWAPKDARGRDAAAPGKPAAVKRPFKGKKPNG
jgi:ATP-dependent RNA helicase DeaD